MGALRLRVLRTIGPASGCSSAGCEGVGVLRAVIPGALELTQAAPHRVPSGEHLLVA